MEQKLSFHIAGLRIDIFSSDIEQLKRMLPGFAPFCGDNQDHPSNDPSLEFFVEESPDAQENKLEQKAELIHSFAIEDGACRLSRKVEKYYFTIQDRRGADSVSSGNINPSLILGMQSDSKSIKCHCLSLSRLHPGHLKFSLWMALAFIGIPRQTVAVHASVLIYANRAVLVLGESGTGKRTHTKLWLRHIVGSRLLNDDSPVIRIELDENNQLVPFVYGSPWSGKGQCYLNERYPVAAFVRLEQHKINQVARLGKLQAFGALFPSFPPAFLKDDYFEEHGCSIISTVVKTTPVYRLQCLPDQSAAEVLKSTIFQ